MISIKEKVAKILLDIEAVTLSPKNPFRYTSGILSPIYTDCRLLISYPSIRKIIKDMYLKSIKNTYISFDVIAGTSTAGIPWAALIADSFSLPMIYVRSSAKEHGKKNQIEGLIKRGQKAIVIEDLISTAKSSIETVNTIRKSNAFADHVFSIMTYGMKKANESFRQTNVKLISLTDFDTVVRVAEKHKKISKNEQQAVLNWAKNPIGWGKKMGFEV